MPRIIQLTEAQLKKVVSNVISEQSVAGAANYGTYNSGSTTKTNDSPEQQIAYKIYTAASGAGTNEAQLVDAINSIKDVQQFYNVNAGLKKIMNGMDIVGVLNDELSVEDYAEAKKISDYLNQIGIKISYKSNSNGGLVDGSFVITGDNASTSGPTGTQQVARQTAIKNAYCSLKNGVIVNPASKVNNMKWEDYVKTYVVTADEIKLAQKSCPNVNVVKKPKMQYTPNENFPLKFGQRGDKIAQLQAAIGQQSNGDNPYDGMFGPKTEALVKLYYPQYDRATGVTEEIFNTLMQPKNNPLEKTKFNTNINRFNTQAPAPVAPIAPAAPATNPA